jgi:hypothetical protein
LQIYFIFARFCKFQKLFDKIKAKELLKEGSKGADVNEGAISSAISSSDGCEGVDEFINVQMKEHVLRTFITHLLVLIHQKTKIALEIAPKIASVNRP